MLTLLPRPRSLEFAVGQCRLESGRRIALVGAPASEMLFSAERLCIALREHAGVEWSLAATATGPSNEIGATLRVDPLRFSNPEAYELEVAASGLTAVAGSPHGIFNAVSTLVQILEQSAAARVPCLGVADSPDFPNRGVMLDISRDKVPTMATLFDLVEMLASWKVNQLQLYTEHTFAYRNHREVWEHASPMTEQDILELDRFCRERFIELVPNQNSFAHMRRWLVHDRYRPLAEAPYGCDTLWGHFDEPFSLNPADARNLDLLRELYDELLPNFSSRQFNVGCDETVDLGKGASRALVEERGVGVVYLDFLRKIHAEVNARGHRMQFWGDIIVQHPELISELPQDVIALEWGYEADHPFDEDGNAFAGSGIPFYVCPGTSSWNSIAGRTDVAVHNIRNAAENGLKHGAMGLLNTDWGDNGHWQYLPISFLGFAYGAAMAWCVDANRDLDLPAALDLFAFRDSAGVMGRMAYDLGNVHQPLGIELHNSTAPFRWMQMSLEQIREMGGLAPAALESSQNAIEGALGALNSAKMKRPDAGLVRDEFASAGQMLRHALWRGQWVLTEDVEHAGMLKRALAGDLPFILEDYRRLWNARNRPGGFVDSFARLEQIGKGYV